MNTGNASQVEYWNSRAGQTWAAYQELLDRQIAPLGAAASRALSPRAGESILDLGCGCGQTSIELAGAVGPHGHVVGVDISAPMLEVARRRVLAEAVVRPEFIEADAATADFGDGRFDAAFSRFGVMFFEDPVSAFANVRRSLKTHGRLVFVCWRPLTDNPWMKWPLEAARPFLPPAAPADPLAPGPFAFADPQRVRAILRNAGFDAISVDPFDTAIGCGDHAESLQLALAVGPLGAALRENPQARERVIEAVGNELKRHETATGVLMPAAVWIVRATRDIRESQP